MGLPSGLLADPLNAMLSLVRNVSPTVGVKMVAVAGYAGGAATTMFNRVLVRVSSRLSAALKVMSWLPSLNVALKDSPVPSRPST
jgi:hypothetical protein